MGKHKFARRVRKSLCQVAARLRDAYTGNVGVEPTLHLVVALLNCELSAITTGLARGLEADEPIPVSKRGRRKVATAKPDASKKVA